MNKKFLVFSILFVFTTLCNSCSEKCFCDGEIIGTISDVGFMTYDPGEKRWQVCCEYGGLDAYNAYYPVALSEEFKTKFIKVKIKGDIYPYTIKGESYIDGGTYYCIDLIEIQKLSE